MYGVFGEGTRPLMHASTGECAEHVSSKERTGAEIGSLLKQGNPDTKTLLKKLHKTKPPDAVNRILEAMERTLNSTATPHNSK